MAFRVFLVFTLVMSLCGQTQKQAPAAAPDAARAVDQKPTPPAEHPSTPDSSIKVQVNEVIVPVTVTDSKGKFVSDLDQTDFQILEEGKPQNIQFFTRERNQPVVVGFLIDMSNASRLYWKSYLDAAVELVYTLLPGDKKYSGYLIAYSNEAELAVNTTTDSEPIVAKLRKLKPSGGAALYDAIYTACTSRKLVAGEPIEPRRVVVVIGNGHDNASKKNLQEALEVAQRNLVTIYGLSTQAFGFSNPDEDNLVKLAEETGGRVEYPLENVYSDVSGYLSQPSDAGNYALTVGTGQYASELARGMFNAITHVAGEITTQYILRYTPNNVDQKKQFRNIVVKVDLPDVKVRARKGYYPFAP
jgi:Ca-activated chloride channel family protein